MMLFMFVIINLLNLTKIDTMLEFTFSSETKNALIVNSLQFNEVVDIHNKIDKDNYQLFCLV